VKPRKTGMGATRAPARRSPSRPERPCASAGQGATDAAVGWLHALRIVSSQDLSPAAVPFPRGSRQRPGFSIPAIRTRGGMLYRLPFALTVQTATVSRRHLKPFEHNLLDAIALLAISVFCTSVPTLERPALLAHPATVLMRMNAAINPARHVPPRGCQLATFSPPRSSELSALLSRASPIYSKRACFDIGAAGPLAGL